MTDTAKEMGKGNYDVKFDVKSYSEINNLAETLNSAAYELGMADNRMKDLIANVSHDLKTPATVIQGYADALRDGLVPPENAGKYLDAILQSVNQGHALFKVEQGEVQPLENWE